MVVSWVPRIISRVQEAAGCATADFPNVICNISQQQGSCIQSVYCLPTGFGCSLGAASQKLTQVMESALGKGSVPGHWKYTLQLQGPSAVLAFLAWGQKVCVHKATTRKWDLLLQVPQIYFNLLPDSLLVDLSFLKEVTLLKTEDQKILHDRKTKGQKNLKKNSAKQ